MPHVSWVLLAYRIPREPSAPRLAIWRRLKGLGVAQLVDGLVALPLDGRNREQLEWLADGILEAGGEAWLWVADPAPAAQGRRLAAALQASIAEQYRAVMVEARRAAAAGSADRRMLGRLRRELDRVRRRDYFPPPEREEAKRVVEALAASLGERAA